MEIFSTGQNTCKIFTGRSCNFFDPGKVISTFKDTVRSLDTKMTPRSIVLATEGERKKKKKKEKRRKKVVRENSKEGA